MATFDIVINEATTEVVGETVVAGDLLYLSSDQRWYKATATLPSKSTTELRLAMEPGNAGDSIEMLAHGYFTFTSFVVSPGTKYYVGTANGSITSSVLTGSNIIRYVGTGFDSNTLLFNPDQTFISDNRRKVNGVDINFSHTHVEADIVDLDKYTQAEVDALIGSVADKHFTFNQASASATWTINHNLGKIPSVSVFDNSGNNVEGEINHTDLNNLTITFNTAFAGNAYLN